MFFRQKGEKSKLTESQLLERARDIAEELGLTDFKGSRSWVKIFKKRRKVTRQVQAQGEAASAGDFDSERAGSEEVAQPQCTLKRKESHIAAPIGFVSEQSDSTGEEQLQPKGRSKLLKLRAPKRCKR